MQAAAAELVQDLTGRVQPNARTDACRDRAVRQHLRHRGQTLRRNKGVLVGRVIVGRNVALREPGFIRGEDRRNEVPSRPDDLSVAADDIGPVHQVQDGVDAVGVVGLQRIDDINGLAVVDLLGP